MCLKQNVQSQVREDMKSGEAKRNKYDNLSKPLKGNLPHPWDLSYLKIFKLSYLNIFKDIRERSFINNFIIKKNNSTRAMQPGQSVNIFRGIRHV